MICDFLFYESEDKSVYRSHLREVEKYLKKKNTSTFYLMTHQEHRLCCSTAMGYKHPWSPLTILKNEISVEECDKIRQELFFVDAAMAVRYWGINYGITGRAKASKLNLDKKSSKYGHTVTDPILISIRGKDYIDDRKKVLKFPFARHKPIINLDLEEQFRLHLMCLDL